MAIEEEEHIPDEVLFEEILVRLPVKSLTVYKSVCKTWLKTIESSSFKKAHRRRHIGDYSDQIIFTPYEGVSNITTKSNSLLPSTQSFGAGLVKMTLRPLEVMLPPEMTHLDWPNFELDHMVPVVPVCNRHRLCRPRVRVLGPIRATGIYCVAVFSRVSLPVPKIAICNPATRDYKLANPFSPEETAQLSDLAARRYGRVHHGFGLAADGDYKVVVVVSKFTPYFGSFLSYVYSLKQGAWKKVVDSENGMVSRLDLRGKQCFPYINEYRFELCPQVFVNGCWHWMAMFDDGTRNVVAFDVDNERFKVMFGPPSYRGKAYYSNKMIMSWVSVLNDHLVLLYNTYTSGNRMGEISVWMMMEYGVEESWINVWTVSVQFISFNTLVGISYSLKENGDGIHINRILFEDWGGYLVSYDEFGAVKEQPGFKSSSCIFWNNFGISAYSETLESL